MPRLLSLLAVLCLVGVLPGVSPSRAAEPEVEALKHFETHIRPLLAARCFKCHGDEKQQGGLRLDRPAALLAGGDSGPAVVAGKPDESLLMEAVRYQSYEMPPDDQLNDDQIAALEKWIAAGAPWPDFDPADLAHREKDDKFTADDRAFWAFQPVRRPAIPDVDDRGWSRNEIDRFVVRKLQQHGLEPAAEASRLTLLRRATFDLTGLPPTPAEVERFLADDSPRAYEDLIDRLLESRHYGERWARHWLDLVRYAESDGFRQDAYRPHAWRYRDYVIQSLNDDKPYSRFVTEQLAGDETAPDDPQALVATGYLRHWIYEYNQRDVRTQWIDILNDVTDTTGDVFLAMGFSCARCHDHKFDPILRNDYYRLQAFFTPLLPRDEVPAATPEERSEYRRQHDKWLQATAEIRAEIEQLERPHADRLAESAIIKFPDDIEAMLRKPLAEREPLEVQLADLAYNQVEFEYEKISSKITAEQKPRYQELQKKLAEFEHLKPKPLPAAYTVTDVGPLAPPTTIAGVRREHAIEPGFLTMLDPQPAVIEPLPHSTGRRTALAAWITSRDNPLTWRVIVNRVWQQHFGRGIVSTPSDFGRLGSPPSHPELLDWLTAEFLARGESLKELHRLIMTSATYRQAALRTAGESEDMVDPTAELLWRMTPRRLDAEQTRDALLAAAGRLEETAGGPSAGHDAPRRSIYCKMIRNSPDPLLTAFDAAPGFASTAQRNVTTTPTQSLLMINGQFTLQQATAMARRLRAGGGDQQAMVEQAYLLAYSRRPEPEERDMALEFLQSQRDALTAEAEQSQPLPTAALHNPYGTAARLAADSDTRRVFLPQTEPLPGGDFTLEAVVKLDSLYADAAVRTIASRWNGNTASPGWSVGVTSTRSSYKPRNLILQLVGRNAADAMKYEVVPSNLHLELNRPYYVAVSVSLSDTTEAGVTFYLRDLSEAEAPLQSAGATHEVVSGHASGAQLVLGGRHRIEQHRWDGLIDEVRLARRALTADELFLEKAGRQLPAEAVVGHWRFDDAADPLADSSPHNRPLRYARQESDVASAGEAAWIDFCHALLNSNEFLYID